MLDKLTKEAFEPRKGESFRLTHATVSGELKLKLASVQGTGLQGKAEREQFSLHFHGPRDPVLPQSIYRLENATMGSMDVFLVPVARDDDGVTYEAVFT
jgi:hypothetical protein